MTKTFIVALCVCLVSSSAVRAVVDTRYETQVISPQSLFGWVGGFGFDGTTLFAATQLDSYYTSQKLRAFQVDQQNNLIEQFPIIPPSYIADRFGGVLSLSGDFALMASPYYGSGTDVGVGIATVLHRGSYGWSSVGQFFGSSSYDYLGQAVDLNGRQLIVGEPGHTIFGGTGQAYVATIPADVNANWGVQLLKGTGPTHDKFGAAVAVDDDIAVVGAPGDNTEGAAFVFQRNAAGVWNQTARLTGDRAWGGFGTAVDVRDGLIVIGAPTDQAVGGQSFGAAYVYRKVGGNWVRELKLGREGAEGFEKFGSAVNIGDAGEILVSLPGYQDVSQRHGAAMVFLPDGPNSWQPSSFLLPSVGTPGSNFGRQVELRKGIAVVSAATDFGNNGPIGAEFIYVLAPEPSSAFLIAIGAFALAGMARRRRRDVDLSAREAPSG